MCAWDWFCAQKKRAARGDVRSPDCACNNLDVGTVTESGWGVEQGSVTELGGVMVDPSASLPEKW